MTQTQRTPLTWLIALPENDISGFQRDSMTSACHGNEKIGQVLGFFVYEASRQAKLNSIDTTSPGCLSVTIECEQQKIIEKTKVSKKTLNTYMKYLTSWGYIQADGYRHTYTVFFRTIAQAIKTPPAKEVPKPRGKYAPKHVVSEEEHTAKQQEALLKLQTKMSKLQSQMVKLQTRMVNLQFEMSKLQSSETAEGASEQRLTGDFEAPRYRDILDKENTLVQTEKTEDVSFVTLARDGGASQSEEHEDAEVSHSQWLSESIQDAEEGHAPGGGTPVSEPILTPAPAAALKGNQPLQPTRNDTTGQARTDQPTATPTTPSTGTSTHQPTETPTTMITPPPITETVQNGKYKKEEKPLLTKTADVRALINAFRGYELVEEGVIKNENKLIHSLCTLYRSEQFTAVFHHLKTCQCKKHKWWREDEHHRGFFAKHLRALLPDILTELGMIPKPEEPPSLAMLTPPTPLRSYTPWMPHEEIIPRAALAH